MFFTEGYTSSPATSGCACPEGPLEIVVPVACTRKTNGWRAGLTIDVTAGARERRMIGIDTLDGLSSAHPHPRSMTSAGYRDVLNLHAQLALHDRGRQHVGFQF